MEPETHRGIVIRGSQRAAMLGFPTANIPLRDPRVSGVYAGRVQIKDEAAYQAAIFADPKRGVIESYLLDFNDELYGLEIEVTLLEKIREARAFTDDTALKETIADDVERVRRFFAQ